MLNKKEFSLPLKVSFISRGLLSSPEMVKTEKQGTHTLWQKLRRKQMRIRERPEAGPYGINSEFLNKAPEALKAIWLLCLISSLTPP